jgi:serine protease Do
MFRRPAAHGGVPPSREPGRRVQVWRKGSTREIPVTVGEMLDEKGGFQRRQSRGSKPPEQQANRLGLVVSELTAEQKRELKMSSGLLIEDVAAQADAPICVRVTSSSP